MDWDDAYQNRAYIAGAADYPARWQAIALAFREGVTSAGRARLDVPYGRDLREQMDLFLPAQTARGLLVFVHGGYWLFFDKSHWSHLAQGALAHGWAVAMPSYPLAPDTRVPGITRSVAAAIATAAASVSGPIRLAGHSAGGHLACRMVCRDGLLPPDVQSRISKVVSISGLHDLRPLLRTKMGAQLFAAEGEAALESPALLEPMDNADVTCWAGADERPEFLRQNALLANIWHGLGALTREVVVPGHHHFNIVDGLGDPQSALVRELLDIR